MHTRMLLTVLAVVALASTATAVPYASGVSTAGTDVTFILNQDADDVTLMLEGGGTQPLGAMTKGTHTVTVPTLGTHQIRVTHSDAVGWTQLHADSEATNFWLPCGVSVNKNPLSPNYGKVYVSESQGGLTGAGRTTTSGIYMLNADTTDAGYANGGKDWGAAGNSSPWKSTIGPDDHLYVTDYSNDLAWEFNADMSSVTALIDASNKTEKQWVEGIHVEGTQAGGDREIYLVNSNYNDTARKGLIQYGLGGNATATSGDTGTQYIGPGYFGFYPRDVARDSNGDWYMNQFRSTAGEAPPLTKFLDSATLPINDADWEASSAYTGAYGLDIYEALGWIAYGGYYDGWVRIFNMADGSYVTGFDAGSRLREVAFDAVGNLYTVDTTGERLRVWSPGGDTLMSTPFTIVPEPATLSLLALSGVVLLWRRRR
ncbi:MAG: PEP-CTERM sorting domain-containing protein [Phycisphaerae bacterium]|nr:PEP-CTERM sorting domain-containing protein [Phycisphaerae bacterium]